MKKFALFALAAAGILSSCSQSSDLVNDLPTPSKEQKEEKTPISFDTYNAKSAVVRSSRAGYAGDMTTAMLQKEGFGVIAYYTGTSDYSAWTKEAPNFMYNTKVYVDGATGTEVSENPSWTYSPTVYWPNDNATADNVGAAGTGGGKLSFFAYAPYVAVTPSTGVVTSATTTGIKALSNNSATSAPTLTYSLDGGVDLLWGTAGANDVTVGNAAQAGATLTGGKADVNVDLTKMKTNGKIKFLFKHALAQINSLKVIADIDNNGAATGGSLSNTKIYVEKVTLANGETGVPSESTIIGNGTFDLTTGVWTAGSERENVAFNVAAASVKTDADLAMNTAIQIPATTPNVNPGVTEWEDIFATPGVTITATDVLNGISTKLIPGANQTLKVTIKYWVTTKDSNLSKGYTWIPQEITKTISLGAIEMNKSYGIVMHLGLTSVKFTATVSDWVAAGSEVRADLPVNVVAE